MKILSILVSKPKTIEYQGKQVSTGIFKEPVSGPVMLRTLNLDGDGQADLRVHGGPFKALYAYSNDAYPEWQKLRPNESLGFGAFGENLTIETLPEDSLFIGDTYKLGGALVQVAQPRFPCYKLAIKFNDPKVLKQFMRLKRPGVYFRVLQEGLVDVGDELQLVSTEPVRFSVLELFTLSDQDELSPDRIKDILSIDALAPEWRRQFESLA